ncbi:MAG: TolC family protein [Prevotellaceae bacterium]|jgi:outer membrane protein TolC|nr:TolC family protein [Prevotellaceae bacterium]
MKKKTIILISILLLLFSVTTFSQIRTITLDEVFELAETQSLDVLVTKNTYLASYWQYRNYKSELLPNITLEGDIPVLNRSLNSYLKEDGTYGFVRNNSLTENLSLSLTQNIPFSGGSFSVQTLAQRIDYLGDNKTTNYMSVPYSFVLQQPLFSSKTLKWAMRIEPERYKEASQQYYVNIETIHMKVIDYYFDLLLAKINLNNAEINQNNANQLYDMAIGKKSIGLLSQDELLQLELGKINAEAGVISAKQVFDNKMMTFRNYLRLGEHEILIPVIPDAFSNSNVTLEQVMKLAYQNNPLNHNMERRLLESQMRIDQAKVNRDFRADLFLSFGATGSDLTLPKSYSNLLDRQIVSIGIKVPILDWQRGKGRVEMAKSEREVVKSQVEQERLSFEQNIILSVSQFHDQSRLVNLAQHADSIAQLRYKTAFQIFVMGQINVLNINNAQLERDNAKRKYINELYMLWLCYHKIRQLTLYDFENNTEINNQTLPR